MRNKPMTLLGFALVFGLALASLPTVAAGGATPVHDGVIWVDGVLYGTVITPTELPDKAPAKSFDALYNFDTSGLSGQRSVAEAAPGDRDYNGGRWMVFAVSFTEAGRAAHDPDGNGEVNFELTSEEAVLAHVGLGHLVISEEPVVRFVCPLIPAR